MPVPATPHRARRTRRARRTGEGISPVALWSGIGAALVVAFILGMAMKGGGGDDANKSAAAPTENRKPQPEKEEPATPLRKAQAWYDSVLHDEHGWKKPLTVSAIRGAVATGEKRGYGKIKGFDWEAKKRLLYKRLLKLDPSDLDANRAHGHIPVSDYPDFWRVFQKLRGARTLPAHLEEFRRAWEGKISFRRDAQGKRRVHLIPAEEWDSFDRSLDEFVAYEKRLQENPQLRAILDNVQRVRRDPLLGRFEAVYIVIHPFVVFYASKELVPRGDSEAEQERLERKRLELQERVRRREPLLKALLAYFEKNWTEPLGLKKFDETDLLYVWLFDDHKSFANYRLQRGRGTSSGLVGFFDWDVQWSFAHEFEDRPGMVVHTLSHELLHHLHWWYSRDKTGKFQNHIKRIESFWFMEGWADHVGSVTKADGQYRFGQLWRERIDTIHDARKIKMPLIPLRLLITSGTNREVLAAYLLWMGARRDMKKETLAMLVPAILSLGYAQAGLFVKFLYEYEDGKYRDKILRYTKSALGGFLDFRGKRGYATQEEVFAQIFDIESATDWEKLQKEYDGYIEKILYRNPPK